MGKKIKEKKSISRPEVVVLWRCNRAGEKDVTFLPKSALNSSGATLRFVVRRARARAHTHAQIFAYTRSGGRPASACGGSRVVVLQGRY